MYKCFKWIMDRLLAFIAVCALSPLFLVLILAIVVDSKGGPFFFQKRDGYKKKTIKVLKFRTMFSTNFAFDPEHPVIASNDAKVTRVGRFLRRFKLDELPQLFNILKGDMSFVGPRPLLPIYTPRYERWEFQKFAVRPGLTGLPQIHGNGYLSVKSRSYYDALYTEKISLWTDFKILLLTVGVIFCGEEAFLKEATEEEIEALKRRYQSADGTVTVGEVVSASEMDGDAGESIRAMNKSGIELHLFLLDNAGATGSETADEAEFRLDFPRKKGRSLRAFRKALSERKFDVIRCHGADYAEPFLKEAKKAGVTVRIAPAVLLDAPEQTERANEAQLRYATMVSVPLSPKEDAVEVGEYYRSLIRTGGNK